MPGPTRVHGAIECHTNIYVVQAASRVEQLCLRLRRRPRPRPRPLMMARKKLRQGRLNFTLVRARERRACLPQKCFLSARQPARSKKRGSRSRNGLGERPYGLLWHDQRVAGARRRLRS